jgi:beta-N-acetylhexosaminidase
VLSAFITALAGLDLTPGERSVLRQARPCGVILFARNIADPGQVQRLVQDAKASVGADILVLVDQEGGRVQRLRPPHWRALPPAAAYAAIQAQDPATALDAARLVARLTAADLRVLGINTNCTPVLDVPVAGSHDIIGDRAYGSEPMQVAALGRAVAEGFLAGGVLPVAKHVPGHGRATADSHMSLPVVRTGRDELEATDFAPFRALSDLPAAMTAHVVFSAIDADRAASISPRVTEEIIRGSIGVDGLLMSDDLNMKALSGSVAERAAAVIAAGSDLALLCSGNLSETESVAGAVPALDGAALARYRRACAVFAQQQPFDVGQAEARLVEALHVLA